MNSFFQPTISAPSNNGPNAMVVLFEREKFISTYIRYQQLSLPDSLIYYISKNPSNSNVYEKMIQSCKYFFIKNPILVVSYLNVEYEKNRWNTFLNGKNVDINFVSSKLWITDILRIENDIPIPPNSLTTVLTKIYHSDAKTLIIRYQKIYISELELLASKCEKVALHETTVINEDDFVVGLEKIVEVLPRIERFHFDFSNNLGGLSANIVTPETVQKLIQIPHFSNLDQFFLSEIPETFGIDTFYDYIKKNNGTNILLRFGSQLSHQYQNRLQTIVNEIIATPNHYNVPFIVFRGINLSSFGTLIKLRLQS